jgi:hypothetical protein
MSPIMKVPPAMRTMSVVPVDRPSSAARRLVASANIQARFLMAPLRANTRDATIGSGGDEACMAISFSSLAPPP